jgi:acyl-coenzyme A thioesterase PaaI-like protein
MSTETPMQDLLHKDAPIRHCYGCGADNRHGLRIKSVLEGDEGISRWKAQEYHCSYPGYLNGGISCMLIDCHSAWTAFALECRDRGVDMSQDGGLPTGWTRAMSVEFLRPVPLEAELLLRARVVKKGDSSRTVTCSIYANDKECVRGEVTMVMKPA